MTNYTDSFETPESEALREKGMKKIKGSWGGLKFEADDIETLEEEAERIAEEVFNEEQNYGKK